MGPSLRFLAIVDVLDDVELVPHAVAHLAAIGVHRIVLVDQGSQDGSRDVIAGAAQDGDAWRAVLLPDASDRDRAVRAAIEEGDADWVVRLSADELLLPMAGRLGYLPELDLADVLEVFRYDAVLGPAGVTGPLGGGPSALAGTLVVARPMSQCEHEADPAASGPWIGRARSPRRLVRRKAVDQLRFEAMTVTPGIRWRRAVARDLIVVGVPLTSLERLAGQPHRIAELAEGGGAAVGQDSTPQHLFERQRLTGPTLARMRREGVVLPAAAVFDAPAVLSADMAARADDLSRAQPWLALAGRVCQREGIALGDAPRCVYQSSYPTVLAPPAHVVKLFPRVRDGHTVREREILGLRRAARDTELPVPGLVAEGALDHEWRYIVMTRLPGENLTWLWDPQDVAATAGVAAWLGRFARRLHSVPIEEHERRAERAAFRERVLRLHRTAARRLAERNALPARLIDHVAVWLPPPDELLSRDPDVLVHGDLQDSQVMTHRDPTGRFEPVGIIDFGESCVGHALYDLGPAWWTFLNVDRRISDAFLAEARFPGWGEPGFGRLALAWVLIRCAWWPKTPPGIDSVADLDELAWQSFGA